MPTFKSYKSCDPPKHLVTGENYRTSMLTLRHTFYVTTRYLVAGENYCYAHCKSYILCDSKIFGLDGKTIAITNVKGENILP